MLLYIFNFALSDWQHLKPLEYIHTYDIYIYMFYDIYIYRIGTLQKFSFKQAYCVDRLIADDPI